MKVELRVNEISHPCNRQMTQENLRVEFTRPSRETVTVNYADSDGYGCLGATDQRRRQHVTANYRVPEEAGPRDPARDAGPVPLGAVPHLPGNTAGVVPVPKGVGADFGVRPGCDPHRDRRVAGFR